MKEIARGMLTVLAVAQAVIMPAVELNRTHATNPTWPGHARFHLVWQNVSNSLSSLVAIVLIWWPDSQQTERFFLAAALLAVPLLGFTVAHLVRPLYNGTMADPNGVPPISIRISDVRWKVDGNTLAIALASITLLLAIFIFLGR